jgi:alkenylglycerophosphocholine hydrolase
METQNNSKAIIWIFWTLAMIYLGLMYFLPFPGSFLPKTLPIWCLAFLARTNVPGATGKLLTLGMLLSSLGDIALTIQLELAFMIGLGFFLLAHVTYIIAFGLKTRLNPRRIPFFVLVVGFGITMAIVLAPHLGGFAPPVYAYLVVITVMVVFSGLRTEVSPLLMLGGLSFMASDAMIAVSKFMQPFPGAGFSIMLTYYLAQFLIVWAFISPRKGNFVPV